VSNRCQRRAPDAPRDLRRGAPAVFLAFTLGACGGGDGGKPTDAAIDAPSGTCGADALFTGEYVFWDSTDAAFCGVQGAKWTVRGDAARTSTTPPNGRFTLCIPHQAQTAVDITPPADPSGCLGSDGTPYTRQAVAIAQDAVVAAGGEFSARAMTMAREAAMFTQVGQPYSATQAQLVVHVSGTPHAVSISAHHAAAQQFTGSAWQAATDPDAPIGSDVWFPNVDPGSVQITAGAGATGSATVALAADRYTYVALIAP
jgi:hypothetical protein